MMPLQLRLSRNFTMNEKKARAGTGGGGDTEWRLSFLKGTELEMIKCR